MPEIGVPEKKPQSIPETSLEVGFDSVEAQNAREKVVNTGRVYSDQSTNPEVGVKSALGNIQAVDSRTNVDKVEPAMLSSSQLEEIIHEQQIALGQGDSGISAKQLLDQILQLSQKRNN